MTFHVEFVAENRETAMLEISKDASLPLCVQSFIAAALAGIPETHAVNVRAKGHLFQKQGDYDVSDCEIRVYRVRRA